MDGGGGEPISGRLRRRRPRSCARH